MKHKHKTYFEHSRKKRNHLYIKTKNRIASRPGRLFYTDHLMDDDKVDNSDVELIKHADQMSWWCDIYFLSKKNRMFYNVCLITKNMAAMDAVDDYVSTEADKRCTNKAPSGRDYFTTTETKTGYSKLSRNVNYNDYFEEYDNLSKVIKQEVIDTKTINIRTDVRMDFSYYAGVGLYATLDVDDLTVEVINKWIQDFWDGGECITNGYVIPFKGKDIERLYDREAFKRI